MGRRHLFLKNLLFHSRTQSVMHCSPSSVFPFSLRREQDHTKDLFRPLCMFLFFRLQNFPFAGSTLFFQTAFFFPVFIQPSTELLNVIIHLDRRISSPGTLVSPCRSIINSWTTTDCPSFAFLVQRLLKQMSRR